MNKAIDLIKQFAGSPVAFHRCYVDVAKSVTSGLMLSQSVYWSTKTKDPDGWFYKTRFQWTEETGLSRTEQESARKKLRASGVIEEKKKGVPCKVYYRVNYDKLLELLSPTSMQESCQLEGSNSANSDAGNQPSITKNTTENTTKSISDIKKPQKNSPPKPPKETWLTAYEKIHLEHLGGSIKNMGQAAKAFTQVEESHGREQAVLGWAEHCKQPDKQYVSPSYYASKPLIWIKQKKTTDSRVVPANHEW